MSNDIDNDSAAWKKRNEAMKWSERMKEIREKAENIKGDIDTLVACKEAGNLKQIAYWVGKLSRDVVTLSQECMGEEMLKHLKEKKGQIITS
jgi:SMC interacting uncharacterized protein involved in chromosome segregation